ncbi:DUF2971 domain-containing protein [Flavobacterium sasangense]|uniref:DUF2971 domain-containing protein n=1 Tax=Flavobacterium sasangense TaxID=503361 RepID=UPI00047D1EAC|nr:DUF2971 domain-containing protein [Flavobacterium sasangense]
MKWETHHTKEITEKYVYRYLTIEKLIDFLDTNSIYLARLDTFEDNLENIEPYDINQLKFLTLSKPDDANPEMPESFWDEIIEKSKIRLQEVQNYLIEKQKKRFVSCWILSDVESFGMWDTYGKSGFVVRFNREYFQKIIRESIHLQTEPTNKIDLLVVGKVFYQDFEKMLLKEKESLLRFSAFRKHLSFKHESEYRIVGFTNENENETGLRFKLPEIESLDFEIFANPRLSSFQFQQYKKIIEKYLKAGKLKESELKNFLEFRNLKY